MLTRRGLLVMPLALFLAPSTARAQQAGKVYRIGTAEFGSRTPAYGATFRQALRDLGWIEGQNIVFDSRCCAEGNVERLKQFVAELVAANVDVLYLNSPHAARAAQAATKTIPIIFGPVSYPVEIGLVASLAKPGGNLTGVTQLAGTPGQGLAKHVELL